jgi:hypothetical protein
MKPRQAVLTMSCEGLVKGTQLAGGVYTSYPARMKNDTLSST